MQPKNVLGVVGGMGPLATLQFIDNIYKLSKVANESDHLRIIADINPQIPSRTRNILYGGEDFVPHIQASANKLESLGANFIAIPCNSAQYRFDNIQEKVKIPIINIFEAVIGDIDVLSNRVLVLGGPVTNKKKTFCAKS